VSKIYKHTGVNPLVLDRREILPGTEEFTSEQLEKDNVLETFLTQIEAIQIVVKKKPAPVPAEKKE